MWFQGLMAFIFGSGNVAKIIAILFIAGVNIALFLLADMIIPWLAIVSVVSIIALVLTIEEA